MFKGIDASQVARQIKAGDLTPVEAVQAALQAINEKDSATQAIFKVFEEEAKERARAMTDLSAPFAGVPIVLKDLGHDLKGQPATAGAHLLKDQLAGLTSNFTQSVLEAGFIPVASTRTSEFGNFFVTDSKWQGPVRNPHDLSRHAGGSSGGAAAAVVSGMVPIATASDGGGSIRIPASINGLIGLKPSRGRTAAGPGKYRSWGGAAGAFALTQSMEDTLGLFFALQNFETHRGPFVPKRLSRDQVALAMDRVKDIRIAYSFHTPFAKELPAESQRALEDTLALLENEGFHLVEARPNLDEAAIYSSYLKMNAVEQAKTFQGISKGRGRRIQADEVEPFSYFLGQYGQKISGAEYSSLLDVWDLAGAETAAFHEDYDLFLQVATTTAAPKIEEPLYDERLLVDLDKLETREEVDAAVALAFEKALAFSPYALVYNLTGQPAISLPLAQGEKNLPLGMHFSAAYGREDLLLALASYLEARGYFKVAGL